MPNLAKLPLRTEQGTFRVIVETPRSATVKLSYDPELEYFELGRALTMGLVYPYDWGFLPSTLGDDGDPLDALIIHDAPTIPGVVICCSIVGALTVKEQKDGTVQRNDRFMAVPAGDVHAETYGDTKTFPQKLRRQIQRFFASAVVTESKQLEFLGWVGPDEAMKLISAGERNFLR
jgi:inorganic pyrophosphatase